MTKQVQKIRIRFFEKKFQRLEHDRFGSFTFVKVILSKHNASFVGYFDRRIV